MSAKQAPILLQPDVIVVELGSQLTSNIERTARELGHYAPIMKLEEAVVWLEKNETRAIIFSGGLKSVKDPDAPKPPRHLLSLRRKNGDPVYVLGICYGHQWIAEALGGIVERREAEHGPAMLTTTDDLLFRDTPSRQTVWMNHCDSVVRAPHGFSALGFTKDGSIAAMGNGTAFGTQFHPEATHTECGKQIIANFLTLAGCRQNWSPESMEKTVQMRIEAIVGDSDIILPFSGGKDSTLTAALIPPGMKSRTQGFTLDMGNLRRYDLPDAECHAQFAGIPWCVIDKRHLVNALFAHTMDPEEERDIFSNVYVETAVEVARTYLGPRVTALQGTIRADVVESGGTGGAKIKRHHNTGIDWAKLGFGICEPLDHLFKYEVAALAKKIGLPPEVYARAPFPGPGNILRVLGAPVTLESMNIAAEGDERVKKILEAHGLYGEISQPVVIFCHIRTVGNKGDDRSFEGFLIVRLMVSEDFMTAKSYYLPPAVYDEIQASVASIPGVGRCMIDITSKPPATIEMK